MHNDCKAALAAEGIYNAAKASIQTLPEWNETIARTTIAIRLAQLLRTQPVRD
jgi:hypothetical protein